MRPADRRNRSLIVWSSIWAIGHPGDVSPLNQEGGRVGQVAP